MFGKKSLSILSLLFIGRALATDITLPLCTTFKDDFASTDCTDTSAAVTHCLGSDNKIYKVTNTGTFACNTAPLATGVYVFNVPASGNNSVVSLTSDENTDPLDSIADRLVMYVCGTDNVCSQTIGYIKMVYDQDNSATSSYYKIETSGGTTQGAGSACTTSTIGDVSATYGVCLGVDGVSVEFSAVGDYLLDGTLEAGSIFTLPTETYNSIVLTATANVIYYNKAFTVTDYCVDAATKKIEVKVNQVCGNNNCENYFSCAAGDCKDTSTESCTTTPPGGSDCNLGTTAATNCVVGYYLADTGLKTLVDTANDAGDLYECEENEITPAQIDCAKISAANLPIGYLINADANHKSAVPIIECYNDNGTKKCKAVDVSADACGTVESGSTITAGKIFSDDAKTTFKLCLDGTNSGAKGTSDTSYLMNASGVLGIAAKADNFMIVNIDTKGNIKIELKADATVNKYKFANSEKKIITKNSSDKSTYCSPTPTLVEYKLNKCDDGVIEGDLVYFYKDNSSI